MPQTCVVAIPRSLNEVDNSFIYCFILSEVTLFLLFIFNHIKFSLTICHEWYECTSINTVTKVLIFSNIVSRPLTMSDDGLGEKVCTGFRVYEQEHAVLWEVTERSAKIHELLCLYEWILHQSWVLARLLCINVFKTWKW